MTKFSYIILILLIYSQTISQPSWEIKSLDSRPIVSIGYINGDRVILFGQNGLSFKTTNSGANWVSKNIVISQVNKAANVNTNNAFAVGVLGGFGLVTATTNAGTNWTINVVAGPLGGVDELRCLSAVNNNICYTGGYNFDANFSQYGGTIFKTTNGGTNWNLIYFQYLTDFTDMYFKNENEGVGLGINKFYKTTNGGLNFTIGKNIPIYGYSFTNPYEDTIYICGTQGRIARSTNNGTNWNVYYMTGTSAQLNRIFAVDSKTVFACGDSAKIFKTTNAGETWINLSLNKTWKLIDVNFITESTGFIVGDSGKVLKTTTGGLVFISNQNEITADNFSLSQNYPNPFNPLTRINYALQITNYVTLNVYDINGKLVSQLVNKKQSAGNYSIYFDGSGLPSGTYVYRLQAGDFSETKKMVLLK